MYRKLDAFLARVKKLIRKLFNLLSLAGFDELNVLRVQQKTKDMYGEMDSFNRAEYRELAVYGYRYAEKYLTEEEKKRLHSKHYDPDELVEMVLSDFNGVTGYVYGREMDRKRLRLFEAICAAVAHHNRQTFTSNLRRSADLWYTQSMQYGIEVTGEAVLQAYRDAGVRRVRWVVVRDGRQCQHCDELDGRVFDINHVPPRPHIGCRCYLVPER